MRIRLQAKTLLFFGVLIVLPLLVNQLPFLGPSWVRLLAYTLLYMLLALGLNIVVGYAGLLDLGYIAFYAVGAYGYALFSSPHLFEAQLSPSPLHWPFWVVIPFCAVFAGLLGMLLGAPTLKLRGDYLAIVTLGFGEIIRIFMNNLDRPYNLTNGPQGINHIAPLSWGSVSLKTDWQLDIASYTLRGSEVIHYYWVFLVAVMLIVLISHRLENSRIGRAWMALREDEVAAEAMGINKRNIKLLAFGIGAVIGGLAGSLFASFQGFISPESFGLMESIMVLSMVVLGGMGSIPGVLLGALLLSLMPELFRAFVGWAQPLLIANSRWVAPDIVRNILDASTLRMLLFGLALLLMMRYRPEGLWPSRRHRAEWHNGGPPSQLEEHVFENERPVSGIEER